MWWGRRLLGIVSAFSAPLSPLKLWARSKATVHPCQLGLGRGRPGITEEQWQHCSCCCCTAVCVSGRWPAPKAMAILRGAPRSGRMDSGWAWDEPTLLQMSREATSPSRGKATSELHQLTSMVTETSTRRYNYPCTSLPGTYLTLAFFAGWTSWVCSPSGPRTVLSLPHLEFSSWRMAQFCYQISAGLKWLQRDLLRPPL